jgi:hypothetical protein
VLGFGHAINELHSAASAGGALEKERADTEEKARIELKRKQLEVAKEKQDQRLDAALKNADRWRQCLRWAYRDVEGKVAKCASAITIDIPSKNSRCRM